MITRVGVMGEKKVTKFGWMMIALYLLIMLFYGLLIAFFGIKADTKTILISIGILFIPTILFLKYGIGNRTSK